MSRVRFLAPTVLLHFAWQWVIFAWHCFCRGDAWCAYYSLFSAGSEEEVAWRLCAPSRSQIFRPGAHLCLLDAFVPARFSIFFGLALIWNKKTDVWVTRGSIYALASTTSLPCFFLARLAWLLLLSLFIRHGLASSSTPSTL